MIEFKAAEELYFSWRDWRNGLVVGLCSDLFGVLFLGLLGGRSSSNWQVFVTSHTGIERENRRSFQRTAMPSRSCVELKGRPVKRFAERSTGVKQGELGIAKSCVGSLSFFQLPVKFVHELGS